jgi:hypothetical protein
MYKYVFIYLYVHMNIYIYIHVHIHLYVCIYIYKYICIHIHIWNVPIYMYAYMRHRRLCFYIHNFDVKICINKKNFTPTVSLPIIYFSFFSFFFIFRCKNHFDFSDHIVLYLVQYIIPSTLELTYIYIQVLYLVF